MVVETLTMVNFRNYEHQSCQLGERTLVLGDNGQGKSNLLEAVTVLVAGASFRTHRDEELVRWGCEAACVRGTVWSAGDRHCVEVLVPREGAKITRIDGKPYRHGERPLVFTAVTFCPDDLRLVKGAPADRRRYVDDLCMKIYPSLRRDLVEYARAVYQRNTLLGRLRTARFRISRQLDPAPEEGRRLAEEGSGATARLGAGSGSRELDTWDELVSTIGSRVVSARMSVLAELIGRAAPYFGEMMPSSQDMTVGYASSASARGAEAAAPGDVRRDARPEDREGEAVQRLNPVFSAAGRSEVACKADIQAALRRALAEGRDLDIARGTTGVGPHRDEVVIMTGGRPARSCASQGQQRAMVLSLKLAEVALIRRDTGQCPLLVLDDVMSELDPGKRALLGRVLDDVAQVLLTTTDRGHIPSEMGPWGTALAVSDGRVEHCCQPQQATTHDSASPGQAPA